MPNTSNSQPKVPFDAIVFDCDGTLSAIEGIDELAEENHVGEPVKALTAQAMGVTGITPAIFQERMQLVKPTREQVDQLGEKYYAHREPGCEEVIALLQRLGKNVFIVSAGIKQAVRNFGERLGIADSNIFAINLEFDAQGNYSGFDTISPFTRADGKRDVVVELKKRFNTIAFVGDGLNDLAVKDLVDRFIGYGGTFYRPQIEKVCEYYVREKSFLALLPLLLTREEYES